MRLIARSMLFLITLFLVGSTIMPVEASAQPYRHRRYHRRYHRPYHRPPPPRRHWR